VTIPVLQTPRLILEPLTHDDSHELFRIFSDQLVIEYYDIDQFSSPEQATQLIDFFNRRYKDKIGIRWSIRIKETYEFIGTCGFNAWNAKMKNAGIGYELASNQWGQGYATEALTEILDKGLSGELPLGELYRVQADTMLGNHASQAVLLKLGFKEEGIRRSGGFWKGAFHDLKCFGLIRPEFHKPT